MAFKDLFNDNNDINEKTVVGFASFVIIVVFALADLITGYTGKDLVIDSTNTYIGKAARGAEGEPVGEPLVLGDTLLELLRELTGILKRGQGMTQAGPVPLGDSQAGGSPGTLAQAITTFEQKLETIISDKHFIEPKSE